MHGKVIWEGRSSPLLYLYAYIGIILLAYLVKKYIGGSFYLWALAIVGYFYFKARSMRYVISEAEIYFSPSIGDNESITVPLTDILAIQVVDRQPWKFFRLGTIILITNPDEEMQPCMKCIYDPHALANTIRRRSQALGTPNYPIETI